MTSRLDLNRFREAEALSEATPSESGSARVEGNEQTRYQPHVTAAILNEAVTNALAKFDYPEETKETFRRLLAEDSDAGFATSYFLGKADKSVYNAHPRIQRRSLRIPYVLTPDETTRLANYAPDIELEFMDKDSHDHALAAACRIVDYDLLMSKVPRGVRIKDIGGNPMFHVRRATPNVHVCSPYSDPKEPSRAVLRRMQARKIVGDAAWPRASQMMASDYVHENKEFCCGGSPLLCNERARVTMSVHNYDVPLEDWPRIMRSAGCTLHEGVILFPSSAYTHTTGVMPSVNARFEVNVETNEFSMGFIGSSAWWYQHKWTDYMRYGVDQDIDCDGSRYSYKVVERRGDTLFFRIMRVAGPVAGSVKGHYKLPGIPMVTVQGYGYNPKRVRTDATLVAAPVVTATRTFPASLWADMMQEAQMQFEKGNMDFNSLHNYYRTVSPRNTINGVLQYGGTRIPMEDEVFLVVWVGVAAAASVLLEQRATRSITDQVRRERSWNSSSGVSKLFQLFVSGAKGVASAMAYFPVIWLCDKLLAIHATSLQDTLVTWSNVPEVQEIAFSDVVGAGYVTKYAPWLRSKDDWEYDDAFVDFYRDNVDADHLRAIGDAPDLARIIADACREFLSEEAKTRLNEAVAASVTSDSNTRVGTVTEVSDKDRTVNSVDPLTLQTSRCLAIQECIDEAVAEEKSLVTKCGEIFRVCCDSSNRPMPPMLKSRREEYWQPDLWLIRNGVLVKSALGLSADECRYSALYTLKPDVNGVHFRTVRDETYRGFEDGVMMVREHKTITDSTFTGWALSMDRLLIFNGPEVQEALRKSLELPHTYEVVLMQGPPGCGKTYDLLNNIRHSHVAMCPVRESAIDTRKRLSEKDPTFPDVTRRVRTVDSYLVNYDVGRNREMAADVLQADEVFMTHAGKWYAVAAMLGVDSIVAYGDINQIPHVPRVQAPSLHLRIQPTRVDIKYDIYRCPADALAAWGHLYDWRARTHSTVRQSMSVRKIISAGELPHGCVLMCMYQAGKKQLRDMYAASVVSKQLKILTVHESQGKTFKDVCLFQFDTRKRDDDLSLYDKVPYVLVALSRHTHTFTYVRQRDIGDKVEQFVAQSRDIRRVAAMADVASVGVSMEIK